MNDPTPQGTRRNTALVVILVLFFGSMLGAGLLRFSGWQPQGGKSHGILLDPPLDLRGHAPALAGGGSYAWNPDARTWRILLAPPAGDCGELCARAAGDFDKVWRLMGRNADRVDILWLCADAVCEVPPPLAADRSLRRLAPDPSLRARLPGVDEAGATMPVYLVDPNGFLMMRYPPGADVGGVRADVAKLLKLV